MKFKRCVIELQLLKTEDLIKLEKISTLKENNHKRFKVEIENHVDKDYFNIDGINNLEIKGNMVSFLFRGNINLIMKKLSDLQIDNIWIEEPDLEEIFMHYYEKGE